MVCYIKITIKSFWIFYLLTSIYRLYGSNYYNFIWLYVLMVIERIIDILGYNLVFELMILYEKWKLDISKRDIGYLIKDMKQNILYKIRFLRQRKEVIDILTPIVKEKGISKIISDYMVIEDIERDNLKIIQNEYFENGCNQLKRFVNKSLNGVLEYRKDMVLRSIFIDL